MELPDGGFVVVNVPGHSRTNEVYRTLVAKLGLRQGSMDHFALFKKEKLMCTLTLMSCTTPVMHPIASLLCVCRCQTETRRVSSQTGQNYLSQKMGFLLKSCECLLD